MLAWILEAAGRRPNFLIGGVAHDLQVSARYDPAVQPFVIEADEYDTAFFDKRSKFVHYRPRTAILNNLEYDHADIFPDLAAIETQFHHLVRTLPSTGHIIHGTESPALDRVLDRGCWTSVETFGPQGLWQAAGNESPGRFDVVHDGQTAGTITWALTGRPNQLNEIGSASSREKVC